MSLDRQPTDRVTKIAKYEPVGDIEVMRQKRSLLEVDNNASADEVIDAAIRNKEITDEDLSDILLVILNDEGSAPLQSYSFADKHKSKLIHLLVVRNKFISVRRLAPYLDLNEQRSSDQCTPLHLSAWCKNPDLTDFLADMGADPSLTNKYGETTEDLVRVVRQRGNIAFIDLEMTDLPSISGLDGRGPEILEIALIITDKNLNEIERGHWIINPGPDALESIGKFGQTTFANTELGGNNLLRDIEEVGIPPKDAQSQLMEMLQRHCPPQMCPLGGNSVHCDREVLKERMREVYDHMSHQIIDVSTILQLCGRWGNCLKLAPELSTIATAHRAMSDTERAVKTLQSMRETVFITPGTASP